MKDFKSKQFLMFLLTGGAAAAVNFLSRILYSVWLGFTYAIILAYLTGMITAFLLAKKFVFKNSQQKIGTSIVMFTVVNGVAIIQTLAISTGLYYYILPNVGLTIFSAEISHGIGVVIPVFTSYLGHKYWSFK
ncbi:GtrA family protein [Pseudomonas siliginis]|uniref:GtrA family protein n=1 Tax=Pseudomonas siliginis TaxID=2842346 RepID=UPI003C2ED821